MGNKKIICKSIKLQILSSKGLAIINFLALWIYMLLTLIQIVSRGLRDDKLWQLIWPSERNLLMAKVAKKQVAGVFCIPLLSCCCFIQMKIATVAFKPNSPGQHKFAAQHPGRRIYTNACCDATLRCRKDNTPTR